jgi:hypothetical protein
VPTSWSHNARVMLARAVHEKTCETTQDVGVCLVGVTARRGHMAEVGVTRYIGSSVGPGSSHRRLGQMDGQGARAHYAGVPPV